MLITTGDGRAALLTYCANAHPGERLDDVLDALRRFGGAIRCALGADRMGLGLWLSRGALSELASRGVDRLRAALDRERLFAFTLNGFPYGNFHADVVKRAVYHPDWGTGERRGYTLELAEVLAALLVDAPAAAGDSGGGLDRGTISTLPLGHRGEAGPGLEARALAELCGLAGDLARLRDRTGRSIRVCVEPEPGCLLETTADALRLFGEALPAAARRHGAAPEHVAEHLGVCFDTCHQAVAFEDARASLDALAAAGVPVGKVQLSSAVVVYRPGSDAARRAIARFDEPRFLHQARARRDDGRLDAADDLGDAGALPTDRPWRVHFHVPIHRELVGEDAADGHVPAAARGVGASEQRSREAASTGRAPTSIGTTRTFLVDAIAALRAGPGPLPHLEVETYTWSVLPDGERPTDDAALVAGIAAELRWAMEQLA
jgi:sugar phosphate isomerase/epimerase